MRNKPKWQRIALNKYRRELRRSGQRTFKSAMDEWSRLLTKHCLGTLSVNGEVLFEKLQTLRRLKLYCRKDIRNGLEREKRIHNRLIKRADELLAELRNPIKEPK